MADSTFSTVTIHDYQVESMSAKAALSFECTLKARTATFTDISSLYALQGHIGVTKLASGKTRIQTTGGTKASLVINGVTYTNCYISDLTWWEVPNARPFDVWEYTVSFVQETV
jgi:hypothetical protein